MSRAQWVIFTQVFAFIFSDLFSVIKNKIKNEFLHVLFGFWNFIWKGINSWKEDKCLFNFLGLFSRLQTPLPAQRAFSTSQPSHGVAGPVWNLGRLNHVAIAVPDLEKATAFYKNVLGAQVSETVPLPDHGVSVVFVNLGNTKMELLHPLGSDSPIAGFLQKNKAGGMHHVCIEVFLF